MLPLVSFIPTASMLYQFHQLLQPPRLEKKAFIGIALIMTIGVLEAATRDRELESTSVAWSKKDQVSILFLGEAHSLSFSIEATDLYEYC